MANVTVSATETALNVSTTLSNITVIDSDGGQTFNVTTIASNITVSSPLTNVVISETAGVDPGEVRSYISATSPILYDTSSGVISFDSNASFAGKTTDDLAEGITNKYFSNTLARAALSNVAPIQYNSTTGVISIDSAAIDIANANVTLKEFHETVYDNGNISGNVTFDLHNGTIHKAQLIANVTNITFANATAGSGITLLLQQDTVGNWVVDTTPLTTWEFAGNIRVVNNEPSSNTMIAVLYDGDKYKSSWIKFDEGLGVDLSGNNTDQLAEGSTNRYFSNTLARAAISVTDTGGDGSLSYSSANGVITYVGPNQQDANARITAAPIQVRFHFTGVSPITYDGITGNIGLSSTANITTSGNISGGNLLATRGVFTSNVTATGNITSSGNIAGNYFIGNGSLLTGVTSLTNAQVLAYIATQPLTVGGNLDVNGNINATGNINYQNVTDLYVTDQKITLNANAATNSNVEIIAYRPTGSYNATIRWNESVGRWEFTGSSYSSTFYPIPTNTNELAESSPNLYFTPARVEDVLDNYNGTLRADVFYVNSIIAAATISSNSTISASSFSGSGSSLTGISTSQIAEGANLWYTDTRANTAIDNRVTKSFVEGLGISYTSLTDKPTIPTHTSNLVNDSGFITVATANVISVNGETGVVVLDTGDIAEGANLYYTTDRANTAIGAYQGAINTAGNITTSANVQGQYILGNGAFLTGITAGSSYGDSNVTSLLANLGSNAISSTANITTTADINVSGNVFGNIVASQINHPDPFGAVLINSIFVDELAIGRSNTNRIFISGYGGEPVSQGQYLRITSTSPQTATFTNFGLSYQNIGSFGNVSAGDPANISYSQTYSVVRAELSGDVADITVSGVASGDTGWIVIAQQIAGGKTLTLPSNWRVEGCVTGNPVPIALGSSEESLIFWTHDGTNYRATVTPNIGSNVSVDIKTTGNVAGGNANITNAVNAVTVNAPTINTSTINTTGTQLDVNGAEETYFSVQNNTDDVRGLLVSGRKGNALITSGIDDSGVQQPIIFAPTHPGFSESNNTFLYNQTMVGNEIINDAIATSTYKFAEINHLDAVNETGTRLSVTNGTNFAIPHEGNIQLSVDRNNNTANVSVGIRTGITNYYGGLSPDRIRFSGNPENLSDGIAVTFSGFTDATVAGALNGNVFYLKGRNTGGGGATQLYQIYSDAALTTPVNLGVGNINAGPGVVTFRRHNEVDAKDWSLNLDANSNDLRIKEDNTTRITFASGGNVNIGGTANASSVIISQAGTAGTYANTFPVDPSFGIVQGSTYGDDPTKTFVSIYYSGQQFPVGSPFQLTFEGVAGPGAVNLNDVVFYSDGVDYFSDGTTIQLFTDAAATVPANSQAIGIITRGLTGGGNVKTVFTPGTSGNNWQLSSVSGNLDIAHNGTIVGNINSAGNLTITGRHTYDRVYGEFCYVGGNIVPVAADTIYAFPLDTTNFSSDVTANNTSRINITKPGIFKLIMSLQVENTGNTVDNILNFWLRKNGTNVANSNTQVDSLKLQKQVVAMDWMVESDGDDYFEIVYFVNSTEVHFPYVAAQTSPVTYPATPPIIVNVIPVGA